MRRSTFWRFVVLILGLVLIESFYTMAKAELTEGLVLYMDFDQGETDVVKDQSGNKNKGAVKGDPQWVEGPKEQFGQAIELDGDGDFIEVPDNASINMGEGDISFMLWVRQAVIQIQDHPRIISKMPLLGANGPGFEINTVWAGLHVWYGLSGDFKGPETGPITDGQWHHLAGVKDGEEAILYLDGELKAKLQVVPIDISNDLPLAIGNNAQLTDHTQFTGALDEVCVYNRALTIEEVKAGMEQKIPPLSVDPSGKLGATWGWLKQNSR